MYRLDSLAIEIYALGGELTEDWVLGHNEADIGCRTEGSFRGGGEDLGVGLSNSPSPYPGLPPFGRCLRMLFKAFTIVVVTLGKVYLPGIFLLCPCITCVCQTDRIVELDGVRSGVD